MPDNESNELGTTWSERFLPSRLFGTFGMALLPTTRLLLCLACVLICYGAGRLLDQVWLGAGAGVAVSADGERVLTEIEAHATLPSREFVAWCRAADEELPKSANARSLIEKKYADAPADILKLVAELRDASLKAIDADPEATTDKKQQRREKVLRAADYYRFVASGCDTDRYFTPRDVVQAAQDLVSADTTLNAETRSDKISELDRFVPPQKQLLELDRRRPRGPFGALLEYEINAFSAAVDGTCAFRFGFAGNAMSLRPSMLGSLGSGAQGLLWLATQRPWYALVFAIVFFVVFSFFGGAACRMAALQAARHEHVSVGSALRFSREKFLSLLFVPIVPLVIFVAIAALIVIGGVFAAIPFVGEVLAGLFYFMALLGGMALALLLIGSVLGFGLMWPTIAVEGSDSFDATARSFGYVGQRTWLAGYYSVVLLMFGGMSLVMVRLIAMVTLKLTHTMTDWGMSVFGLLSSAQTDTFSKLDAMWQMPAWSDLTLIPSTRSANFWGSFGGVPLDAGETIGSFLIAVWVFLVVGVVAAFAVNFFFCGSTQIYYLLRREVDSTDLEEVFTDDDGDDLFDIPQSGSDESGDDDRGDTGTSLPIVTTNADAPSDESKE